MATAKKSKNVKKSSSLRSAKSAASANRKIAAKKSGSSVVAKKVLKQTKKPAPKTSQKASAPAKKVAKKPAVKVAVKKQAAKSTVKASAKKSLKKPAPKVIAPAKKAVQKAAAKKSPKKVAQSAPKKSAQIAKPKSAKAAKKALVKKQTNLKKTEKKPVSKPSIMKKSSTPQKNLKQSPSKKEAAKSAKPAKVNVEKTKPTKAKLEKPKAEKVAKPKAAEAVKEISKPEKTKAKLKEILEKRGAKKSAAEVIAKILKSKNSSKSAQPVAKVEEVKVEKTLVRASAGIYFSLEDVDNFLSGKAMTKTDEKYSQSVAATAIERKKAAKKAEEVAAVMQVPKRALAAASIADILGFNPIEQSRTVYEEKDVPAKWKKYYKLLVEIKDRLQNGASHKTDAVANNNGELSHENSTQGMDVADIGSKNFERDMALSLLSTEQNIVSEVNAAIERMRSGTYGICEVTGKPIPESRLTALPFARCTVEGQKQKEAESRRMKAGAKREQFGVDIQEDFPTTEVSEDGE